MTLMVVFAIGDLSFASSPLAVPVLFFFVHFGKKAMEFWDGGIHQIFAANAYEAGDLFNEGMRDMCTYGSFLPCIK